MVRLLGRAQQKINFTCIKPINLLIIFISLLFNLLIYLFNYLSVFSLMALFWHHGLFIYYFPKSDFIKILF